MNKNILIFILIIVLLLGGLYMFNKQETRVVDVDNPITDKTGDNNPATTTTEVEQKPQTVIGQSAEGREIMAYHYWSDQATTTLGKKEVLFVGGVHGGYSPNTVLVARELMSYLKSNPNEIPSQVKVTVIPLLNPDGLTKVVSNIESFTKSDISSSAALATEGRFNANNVDLNRNFDCDWQADGKWQNKDVSGGTAAFSEPESRAIKNYVETNNPKAVVVWYSAAGGVFASNCHNGVSTETDTLTSIYAKASGYPAHQNFDFYETTGDMTNWLAKNNIPAISVLLTDHKSTEWSKNKAGIEALLEHYSKTESE